MSIVPRRVFNEILSDVMTPTMKDAMQEARELGLGPRNKRTPFKPSKSNGSYKGGAKFERDDLAIHVGNAPRCYTLVQSYQVQRNIVGPAAGTKISMGQDPTDHLLMREKIVKVRCPPHLYTC